MRERERGRGVEVKGGGAAEPAVVASFEVGGG
jgi:hypothetical protein